MFGVCVLRMCVCVYMFLRYVGGVGMYLRIWGVCVSGVCDSWGCACVFRVCVWWEEIGGFTARKRGHSNFVSTVLRWQCLEVFVLLGQSVSQLRNPVVSYLGKCKLSSQADSRSHSGQKGQGSHYWCADFYCIPIFCSVPY